jgi:hypothetical protein
MLAPPLVRLLAAGVVLGGLWRLIAPALSVHSDRGESQVALDGSFFVGAAALGVVTAVVFLRRPGPRPAQRLGLVLVGATAASGLAVAVSWALGGPVLAAWGGLLIWPWVTALLTAVVATARLLTGPARPVGGTMRESRLNTEDSVKE